MALARTIHEGRPRLPHESSDVVAAEAEDHQRGLHLVQLGRKPRQPLRRHLPRNTGINHTAPRELLQLLALDRHAQLAGQIQSMADGGVFVTGSFTGTVNFNPLGNKTLTAVSLSDVYLEKLTILLRFTGNAQELFL